MKSSLFRKKSRPTQDEYFVDMALLTGTRSNCFRRGVGCVLIDEYNNVLATGYNGVPRGFKHCTEADCPRTGEDSGKGLKKCLAVHSEMNAMIFCHDINKIAKAYVTVSPCLTCTVMLLNTTCKEIVFEEGYPNNEQAKVVWEKAGRIWTKLSRTGSPVTD